VALSPEQRALLRGFRMPAEWEPHVATYAVWPHNRDTWPGRFERIPAAYAEMVAAISQFEPVRLLVNDRDSFDDVRATVARAEIAPRLDRIELIHVPTNDSWVRDSGPIFVNRVARGAGPAQLALDFGFNSWGEKWGAYDLDDSVPRRLAELYGFDALEPGIVLEGGSIDCSGAGSLLTTEACLLNPNRNPALSRAEIEQYLRDCLGVASVLWLGEGIVGDDTDGHIDGLARFVARDAVVAAVEEDPADENYRALQDNLARLRAMRIEDGRPLRIATLPMPAPVRDEKAGRLPASYVNFYIANGAVIMPTFACPADQIASATLARLFAGRRVVGVPSSDLVLGLGSIHCLTQQHPAPPA
jgi:agmatine deiminase